MIEKYIGGLKVLEVPGDPAKGTIVLMHGYGADAGDLALIHNAYSGPTWIFPQGPMEITFAPGMTGRAWFEVDIDLLVKATQEGRDADISKAFPPELTEARTQIDRLLDGLNIPRSDIILGGFSQGAVLAVETALHSTDPLKGLVLLSGTLVNAHHLEILAPRLAPLPFFQSHGTRDQILPLAGAQALARILQASGLTGELHIFEGGHNVPSAILKKLASFLQSLSV